MDDYIYMDNAATTKMCDGAIKEMMPYMKEYYANISSSYSFAKKCERKIEECRQQLADTIGAKSSEIIFNSGGTEGDNQAIGLIRGEGKRILVSIIEHKAVLKSCNKAKERGINIDYIPVDEEGYVDMDYIKGHAPGADMISVMLANNEVGVIEPVKEISAVKGRAILHCDAVAAYGHIPINVREMGIDIMNVSAHKFGGPKGTGFMYVKEGIDFAPMLVGGGQERLRRAGTVNTMSIAGMCRAATESIKNMQTRMEYERALRDIFIRKIIQDTDGVMINGGLKKRLSGNINVSFSGIDSVALIAFLDDHGICVSRASACDSNKESASHVLSAMKLSEERIRGSIRITLNYENTITQVMYVATTIKEGVERLRKMQS